MNKNIIYIRLWFVGYPKVNPKAVNLRSKEVASFTKLLRKIRLQRGRGIRKVKLNFLLLINHVQLNYFL